MPPLTIMIIRHAEKPDKDSGIQGVSTAGAPNKEELTVRGWQRAGALARFFAPRAGFALSGLPAPVAIFASGLGDNSASLRPQHTVQPLAQLQGIAVNLSHLKGDEAGLLEDVMRSNGAVLVAWEHKLIPLIANLIVGNDTTVPQQWPDDRFDVVWVFDRRNATWAFRQVPQLLLPGDLAGPIA